MPRVISFLDISGHPGHWKGRPDAPDIHLITCVLCCTGEGGVRKYMLGVSEKVLKSGGSPDEAGLIGIFVDFQDPSGGTRIFGIGGIDVNSLYI